jgi:hypothetical protein
MPGPEYELATTFLSCYYQSIMHRLFKTYTVVMLLIYGIYTMSPIYAVLPAPADTSGLTGASSTGFKVGILWVDVLLDSIVSEGQQGNHVRSEQFSHLSQEEDMVLIKKKRAVSKRLFTVQIPIQTIILSISDIEHPLPVLVSYEIPRDFIHSHSDEYYSLSTGLSPPSFLS